MRGPRALFLCLILLVTVLQPVLAINDYGEDEDYLGQVVDDYENDDNVSSAYNVINNATLDCMELVYSVSEGMILENFTTYTEQDEGGGVSVDDYFIDAVIARNRNRYVYFDFGADYFGNFKLYGKFRQDYHDSGAFGAFSMFSNYLGNQKQHRDNNEAHICWIVSGSAGNLKIYEFDGAGAHTSADKVVVDDTFYWFKMEKVADVVYLDVYTTEELRDAEGNGNWYDDDLTLQSDYSFRYFYVFNSFDDGLTQEMNMELYDFKFNGTVSGYQSPGHYYTEEMLDGDRALALLYNASIPVGTGMTMDFSSDNVTWVDHNNAPGSDTLIAGFESLDLRDPNFTALYSRINMTSTGEDTPRIYQFRLVTITNVTLETVYQNVTGAWVDYNFTSIVTVVGDNVTGFLNSTYFKDGDFYSAYEVTGAPGYDIRFNVTGLPDNLICICLDLFMYYDGSAGHTFQIEVWNFTDSNWDFIEIIPDECCQWFNNTLECVPDDYIQNGTLMGRFYHPSPGNVNHVWGIDYGKLRVYVPYEVECEEVPVTLAMGRYYAMAIILLILGILLGLGMRGKR